MSSCLPYKPAARLAAPANARSVDVSPDGKWLCCWATSRDDSSIAMDLWISATNRTNWKWIGRGMRGTWRPDSSTYAFTQGDFLSPSVALVRVGNWKVKRLTAHSGPHHSPAWSPDGKRLAIFAATPRRSPRTFTPDYPLYDMIMLLRPDGTLIRRFPLSECHPTSLTWSPDARLLAYSKLNVMGNGSVHVLSLRTGREKNLALDADEGPLFWLDSRWIMSRSGVGNSRNAHQFHLASSDERIGSYLWTQCGQRASNREFVIALSRSQRGHHSIGALWQGALSPKPHLTQRLAQFSLPESLDSSPVVTMASRQKWFWTLNGRVIRAALLGGPYSSSSTR